MKKVGKTIKKMIKIEVGEMVKKYGLRKYDLEKKLNHILSQLHYLSKASLNNSKIVFAHRNEKDRELLKIADWSLEDNDNGRNKAKINLFKDLKVKITPYFVTVELYHPKSFWSQSQKKTWLLEDYPWEENLVDEINRMLKKAFDTKNPPQISNKIATKKEE